MRRCLDLTRWFCKHVVATAGKTKFSSLAGGFVLATSHIYFYRLNNSVARTRYWKELQKTWIEELKAFGTRWIFDHPKEGHGLYARSTQRAFTSAREARAAKESKEKSALEEVLASERFSLAGFVECAKGKNGRNLRAILSQVQRKFCENVDTGEGIAMNQALYSYGLYSYGLYRYGLYRDEPGAI